MRVGERALVVALGVARLAVQRQRDAERDRILRQHQIGRLQDIVALDHAPVAGDRDRLDIVAGKPVLGLQVAHRAHRGMRRRVARIALQHRAQGHVIAAETAGQLASSNSVQNTRRKPNSPSMTVRGPAKPAAARLAASTPASEARPRCSRLTVPPSPRANSSKPAGERPGDAERVGHPPPRRGRADGRTRPRRRTARSCPARESRAPRWCGRWRGRSGS